MVKAYCNNFGYNVIYIYESGRETESYLYYYQNERHSYLLASDYVDFCFNEYFIPFLLFASKYFSWIFQFNIIQIQTEKIHMKLV